MAIINEMRDNMKEFIESCGVDIIKMLLSMVIGYVAIVIKNVYKTKVNTEEKKKIVDISVKAIEQMCGVLSSTQKFKNAKKRIVALFTERGFDIDPVEIETFIEAAVKENFNMDRTDKDTTASKLATKDKDDIDIEI